MKEAGNRAGNPAKRGVKTSPSMPGQGVRPASHDEPVLPEEDAPVSRGPETWLAMAVLVAMSLLPLWDIVSRKLGMLRVPGSSSLVQHLTLWITFVGAALAARSGRLLTLSTTAFLPRAFRGHAGVVIAGLGAAICAVLAVSSVKMILADRIGGEQVAIGISVWAAELVIPAGYAVIAGWLVWKASARWGGRLSAAAGILVPALLAFTPAIEAPWFTWAGCAVVVLSTVAGLPLFLTLGGLALILFWTAGTPLASVPAETYRLAANPMLPAIPMFTLAGHVLSAGGACKRLVRVFGALVGWLPGGLAIVTVIVFAFFTSFTGASGVTILSLGGLLLPILVRSGYPVRFSIGLLTASGSIGLLFPPSLPVILYSVRSLTIVNGAPYVAPIDELFIAGLVPGFFLVVLVSLWGVRQARKRAGTHQDFDWLEAVSAVWEAKWELAIPLLIVLYFGGLTTIVETAALTLVWSVAAECLVYRDLSVRRDLPRVTADGAALVGGVLVILGAALGFTNYLVDAQVPEKLAAFVQVHVTSRFMFLLLLNLAMIVIGSVIEIYSAILVVVPLITPMGAAFGINPVHLGIIFLANLELGYLAPPVGLNLLLSSYRFKKPMPEVARDVLPFLVILLIGVLLITYVPFMSLGLLHFLRGTP